MADPTTELLATFNELNSGFVEELTEEPSPLEFMRHVARNTPFVVRHAASEWAAVQQWSAAYLRAALAGYPVNVAITPCGNADAPTLLRDRLVFAKPLEETQPFEQLLDYVAGQELDPSETTRTEIRYAQTRESSLDPSSSRRYLSCPTTAG